MKKEKTAKEVFSSKFREITKSYKNTEVAKMLGKSLDTINKWRSDTNNHMPDTAGILSICKAFNCDPNYLFGYDDSYNIQYKEITEQFGLSSPALDILRQEIYDNGDIRRIDMLNRLLSNRKVFTELMDCLIALHDPTFIAMNREAFLRRYLDSHSDMVVLPPTDIKRLSNDTPENVHHRIRVILDNFINQIK